MTLAAAGHWRQQQAAGSPWERERERGGEGNRLRQSQTKLTIEGGGHCMLLSPVARSPGTVRLGPPSPPPRIDPRQRGAANVNYGPKTNLKLQTTA